MIHVRLPSRPLALLLACSAALLVSWSLIVPIFESPDEPHHWQYARYLHAYAALPPYDPAMVEGNQPPLYYLLIAPAALDSALPRSIASIGPNGIELSCPPRFYENCRGDLRRYWPIRIARLITALLSIGTVLFTALAAATATGTPHVGILSGALVASLPQFSFRGSTVSNDAMVACAGAAATWFLARFAKEPTRRNGALCAITCALALLSKVNAVVLSVAFEVCVLLAPLAWRDKLRRSLLLLVVLALAAPWLIRNQLLYGDPLALGVMPSVVGSLVQRQPITSPYFGTVFPFAMWRSFIAWFGWLNVWPHRWVYVVFATVGSVAIAGSIFGLIRASLDRRLYGVLLLAAVLAFASVVHLNLTFPQPQGRYLFAALAVIMVLVAMGLSALPRWNATASFMLAIALACVNVHVLATVVYPAYWKPTPPVLLVDTEVPETAMQGGPLPPLEPASTYTQSFRASHDNLTAVEIELARYQDVITRGEFRLRVRTALGGGDELGTATVPGTDLLGCCLRARVSFPPIAASKGKTFYISVDTTHLAPGSKPTLFLSGSDVYPAGDFFVNGSPQHQATIFRAYYVRDREPCPACLAR